MSNAVLKPINHDSNEQIYLITDASNVGLSGWIGQKEDGVIRPAAFHSRYLNKSQTNYTTTDKELLVIVDSLWHFRGELQSYKVIVLTDHKPLVTFMTTWQDKKMKIRWQQVMSEFDITIEHIEGKENFIADTLSRAGTYKGSASLSSSDLSSLPNHTHTLPPPVVVNHIIISHQHLLPPITNTNYPTSMPPRRTMSGMTRKPVYPLSSATRPYHRPQSSNSASSSSSTGLGDIFQQERYANEPNSDYSDPKNNHVQRDRRYQELQQRTAWNERQQAIVTAAATTRAQAQQQQEQQEQVELGRLVKYKTKTPNFSIVVNKKPSNSTTMVPPAAPPSPEPKWTLEGPSNSDQVESDTGEEEWIRVNPGPSQEEMVRQIRATNKGKMKYDQMQEWNPTLTRILRRR